MKKQEKRYFPPLNNGRTLSFKKRIVSAETIRVNTVCFIKYFMKNPQTTLMPTFLTHIIARIDGVKGHTGK